MPGGMNILMFDNKDFTAESVGCFGNNIVIPLWLKLQLCSCVMRWARAGWCVKILPGSILGKLFTVWHGCCERRWHPFRGVYVARGVVLFQVF